MCACRPEGCHGIDVSVTVVSTNERHYLEPMLPQLYGSAQGISMEVILVDNAGEDGTVDLEGRFSRLTVIKNPRKLGFSANHNLAMRQARGRYVLCLNPDVLFDPEVRTVQQMVAFMDAHPDCGVAGCRAYDADGEFQAPGRRFQTPRIVLARRAGPVLRSRAVLDRYLYGEHAMHDTYEVDWLMGCFLFMRREALRQVGLFDERYIKYFEDVDLCRRMRCHGWKVMYFGGPHYVHLHQRASRKLFSKDARLHVRSWARWLVRQGYYRRLEKERGASRSTRGL